VVPDAALTHDDEPMSDVQGTIRPIFKDWQTYNDAIVVPANTFPDNPAAPSPGVYKVIVVLLLRNNNLVTDVAAVAEGPLLRIG